MTNEEALAALEKRLACEAIPMAECGAPHCDACPHNVGIEDVLAAMALVVQALRFQMTIVRCWQCRYFYAPQGLEGPNSMCGLTTAPMGPDDFCNHGRSRYQDERRKQNADSTG